MNRDGNAKRFGQCIQLMAIAFGRESDAPLIECYWMGLCDIPIEQIERVCVRAIRECEHMPRPAELRRMLGVLSAKGRAVKAWLAVIGAITPIGRYRSVDFDDPTTNAAIRLTGGWPRLCRMSDRELEFARADFYRVYETLTDAAPDQKSCAYLPGQSELENRRNGHDITPPERIAVGLLPGDTSRAIDSASSRRQLEPRQTREGKSCAT